MYYLGCFVRAYLLCNIRQIFLGNLKYFQYFVVTDLFGEYWGKYTFKICALETAIEKILIGGSLESP